MVLLLLAAPAAWGQIDINSSPSVVGSGARALGMGGAFIAVADDATAASWNPGGLTQLERPEISLVYGWKWFQEDFPDTLHISTDSPYDVDIDEVNYLSLAYPIPWTIAGRNLVLSLNYQRKYEFDRELDFSARLLGLSASPILRLMNFTRVHVNYRQDGHLSALSPAFGFELTDRLSVGAVLNIWDSGLVPQNSWESVTERRSTFNQLIQRTRGGRILTRVGFGQANSYEKYDDIEGLNYTFGLFYRITERLNFGAVYHTAYALDADYRRITRYRNPFGMRYYRSDVRIEWPAAFGLGLAYRFPNDKLTLSLDVTRRDWDSFVQEDPRVGLGGRISPVTGMPKWQSPHDPTYTVRLGAEYVFVNQAKARQNLLPSLRAGLFYDPEPASGRKDTWWGVRPGDGKPDDYFGVTLGAGLLVHNRVNIDAAYEYRWGNGVRKDTLAGAGLLERGFEADVDQHLFYLSTVVYF